MNKKFIILSIIIILIIIVSLFSLNQAITGNIVLSNPTKNSATFTKAICDNSNYCQDYEIKCKDGETISITPITGAAVQFNENWKDPRTQEQIDKSCDKL